MYTHVARTLTKNQIARLARQVVDNAADKLREASTEPVSEFSIAVEKRAFKEKYKKNSIVYHATGEMFPYLQHLTNEVDFGLLTPAAIAAIYITARSGRHDWHVIAAQSDAANYCPSEELIERVNSYFEAAKEPLPAELHEMHQMFETFMRPNEHDRAAFEKLQTGERLQTVTFLAATSLYDTTSIRETLKNERIAQSSSKTPPDDKTCALIFRTFNQQLSWFSKQ